MNTNGWIALAGAILAGLGFVVGLFKYFTKCIGDLRLESEHKITKAVEQGDEKRARIYERLDVVKSEHKNEMDKIRKEFLDSYVHAKVCDLTRAPLNQAISDIKVILADIERKLDKLIVDNAAGK